jgi:hypothetical protein
MRRAGSESWRFAHDIDQTLHALLYVRDALGVDVEEAKGIPDPLRSTQARARPPPRRSPGARDEARCSTRGDPPPQAHFSARDISLRQRRESPPCRHVTDAFAT